MKLIDILLDLQTQPRPMTIEESNHLFDLAAKGRLKSPAERWLLLEQEGMTRETVNTFVFDPEVTAMLDSMAKAATN